MYFLSDSHKIQLLKSVVPLPNTRLTEKDHWRELRWKTAVRLREDADAEKSRSSSQIMNPSFERAVAGCLFQVASCSVPRRRRRKLLAMLN